MVPVFKSGSIVSPSNYRPISLKSIPCKIFEHIIYSNLVRFLESNSFFHPAQHGFRKHHSCETQLLSFTQKIHVILDARSSADCIFLDLSKAFDKVCHRLLMLKLRSLNLDSSLLKWIECFVINRHQFVSANHFNSSPAIVASGVPQGSVLGPLLFLIYINDLLNCVSSPIHLFADDCVVFREIKNGADVNTLQADPDNIATWCDNWRMELNISKCKAMRITRTSTVTPMYFVKGIPLEPVASYKYLGVHITNNLKWDMHIE